VDLLGLLKFESSLQIEVVEKIIDFLSKIVHRVIFLSKMSRNDKRVGGYVV
jgi:hypothetical protein